MSELQGRLEKVMLRLDLMGMRVEQALADALQAAKDGDVEAGRNVDEHDSLIDREEVEIEQECIRLLALYQPAAIDLRMICTIIKINNDLERIADLAAGIGKRVKHVVEDKISFDNYGGFDSLAQAAREILGKTVRMLGATDSSTANKVIKFDDKINQYYRQFVRDVLDTEGKKVGGLEAAMTLINLAKALERIGDLCTNIAEDIIFLKTGDIVRHAEAMRNLSNDEIAS
ncbi:MAG: phosphate signaling complex protein PhoU [Phycisphaerae bacterium]|nr:phosphate signaling complex protein PhoU [Phycisphaerae bacterium]